ncbi:PREDICTED: uncharacterized protein LOC104600428 [Nelumbo nucifera]|uniref:Uncharacterized protein LOC104600428 n=1 Tax=Nelumbo nucifera TaxID=4432 RepID=A0A1U8A944_NELNU|nr:PREDICTED: uncharacterized protein LOC104600428 [Nelumbo nucifera]
MGEREILEISPNLPVEFSLPYDGSLIPSGIAMAEYIQKIKGLVDSLVASSYLISDADLIQYMLGGFGLEYDLFVISIMTKLCNLSIVDVQSLLMSFEKCMERHIQSSSMTANIASKGTKEQHGHHSNKYNNYNNRVTTNPEITTIVTKEAIKVAILIVLLPIIRKATVHLFDLFGGHSNGSAMIASSSASSHDLNWYPNLSATNHMTSNLENLSLHQEYRGNDQISVGNDQGFKISHIGHAILLTLHGSLTFRNTLHVPQIRKNLISISQFVL